MNITWCFGNGLDIGLDLDTKYLDFFADLEKKDIKENILFDIYKNDKNNGNIKLWSDYEVRLGEITEKIDLSKLQKFEADKEAIDIYLEEYLIEQNKKLTINENESQELLKNGIRSLSSSTRAVDNLIIKSMIDKHSTENYLLNAISFNYTDSVSKIFSTNNSAINNMRIHTRPSVQYQLLVGDVLFIHGTTTDTEMVVGLGDANQIKNKELRNNKKVQDLLIKRNLLTLAGQRKRESFISIIEKSDIICLYGLSLGITDNDYWAIIKQAMLKRSSILIYYYFDDDISSKRIFSKNETTEVLKNKFYKLSNATDKEKEVLDNLIIVEYNCYIFSKIKDKN